MTSFDLVEVRTFAAGLNAQIQECENGEGMECANLDATLKHYAGICCQLLNGIREWGNAVFTGKIAFDDEVQSEFLGEAVSLYAKAWGLAEYGHSAEDGPCWILEGQCALGSALFELGDLLRNWVPPQLAVGPAAREGRGIEASVAKSVRDRIMALPQLPVGWQPQLRSQQRMLRRLKAQ